MNNKRAVVCNYALNPNRIGGIDWFYVRYDAKAKQLGIVVDHNENPLHQSDSNSDYEMRFCKLDCV